MKSPPPLVTNARNPSKICMSAEVAAHTMESMNNIIDLYGAWNKPEDAEKWRAKLPKTEVEIE